MCKNLQFMFPNLYKKMVYALKQKIIICFVYAYVKQTYNLSVSFVFIF